jgi:hypothetical protein
VEDKLLMLSGGAIYEYEIKRLINEKVSNERHYLKIDFTTLSYQYLMLSRGIKDRLILSLNLSAIATVLILMFFYYENIISSTSTLRITTAVLCFFWLFGIITAFTITFIALMNKALRIEYLLYICRTDINNSLFSPILAGITYFCFMTLLFLPNLYIIRCIVAGFIFSIVIYFLDLAFVRKVRTQSKDVIVELLSEEGHLKSYIRSALENIGIKSNEIISIHIVVDGKIRVKEVDRWFKSRKGIIRNDIRVIVENDKISMVMDLSKRDIKYSRLSIIMDYVCFIKGKAKIKEIQIGCFDDKG